MRSRRERSAPNSMRSSASQNSTYRVILGAAAGEVMRAPRRLTVGAARNLGLERLQAAARLNRLSDEFVVALSEGGVTDSVTA
jgi:hypothetical protein